MTLLRLGSRGDAVAFLQRALATHGFSPGAADGLFGPRTAAQVRAFQAHSGEVVDGIVGPSTWAALGVEADHASVAFVTRDVERLVRSLPSTVPAAVSRALACAVRDVGKAESPKKSNRGPAIAHLVEGYSEFWSIPGRPYLAWCAMAVMVWTGEGQRLGSTSLTMRWRDHVILGRFEGRVSEIKAWGEANHVLRPGSKAMPGDIFVMSREGSGSDVGAGGHTGLVVGVQDGAAVTIEGNVSDQVGVRMRPLSSLTVVQWGKRLRL